MPLDVGELVARLSLDDSRFVRAMQQDEQLVDRMRRGARDMGRDVEGSIRDATRQADRLGTGAQGARRDLSRVGDTSRDIDRVADSARRSEREVGRLGEAAERAGNSMSSLAESVSERAGSSGGAGFMSGFSGQIAGLGGKSGPIGAALLGVAALGVTAGAALAAAIADGMEQERVRDKIQAQLGIGEETAEDIGRAAGAAYSNGWGDSVESNMDAARAAIQAGLLTGEEDTATFAHTIERLNTVADLMGEEVPAVARAAGQAMKNDLAGNAEEAFDMLTASQRNSLNVSEDLLDSFDEYSTQLRALGLEGQEGWALVAQGVKAGARDTDVVIDALKEFKLRVTDGTAAAAEGFDKLGVNADDARAAMAAGGDAGRDMLAQLLRGLQGLTDPQERYNAALALFGTKFEDIQDAAYALNLDTAVQEFGKVEGATAKAAETMSSNTAASFDEARRSIEVSMDAVNLALAEAFGPELTKIGDWVATHKPEIMGFFFDLADGALLAGEGIARFVSGALHVIGPFSAITAEAFGGTLRTMGMFVDAAATVADALGMDGMAESLRSASGFLDEYGTKAQENSGALIELARSIDNDVVPALSGMRAGLRESGEQAVAAETMMRALGDTVVTGVPDDKTITIEDNSPEAIKRLEDLGFKVENTPNGITVTAETDEAENIIGGFINRERELDVKVRIHYENLQAQNERINADAAAAAQRQADSGQYQRIHYADGGVRQRANGMLDTAHIANGQGNGVVARTPFGPVRYAEGETGWEAYIPGAMSKRSRSERILQEVAKRFGFGLIRTVRGEAGKIFKGDPSSLTAASDPTGWRALLGGDYSGRTASLLGIQEDSPLVDVILSARKAIAEGDYDGALANYGIHEDSPITDLLLRLNEGLFPKMADGGVVEGMQSTVSQNFPALTMTSGYRSTNDHHGSGLAADFSNGSGNTDDQLALANWIADNYPDSLELIYSDPRFDRNIKNGQFVDPSFYGAATMAQHENHVHWARSSAPSADGSGAIQSEQAALDEGAHIVDSRTGQNVDAGGRTVGTTDSGVVMSTDGQRVFVTNWPDTLGGGKTTEKAGEERKPILTAGLKVFENGGITDRGAQIQPGRGNGIVWAESETEWEGYIPGAASKRPRSIAITREIARRFGYQLVPMADGGLTGFSGYIGDQGPTFDVPLTPEGWAGMSANKRRATMYSLAGLGIGGAFALASGFDENGRFTGQFDTGANSHPALEKGFQALVEKLEEIRKAAQNPDPVDVQVDIDSGSRAAQIEITKRGL